VTVGDNTDVTQNPVCIALGTITDGGWYACPNTIIGTVFGVYSTSLSLNFMEVTAYSQEAIQLGAGVIVSVQGTESS